MKNRIRQFREAQGLNQEALAKLAGVSRSYLAEMESGTKTTNTRRLAQVAAALGVSASDLIEEDEEIAGAVAELVAILRHASQRDVDLILEVARRTAQAVESE